MILGYLLPALCAGLLATIGHGLLVGIATANITLAVLVLVIAAARADRPLTAEEVAEIRAIREDA